MARIEVKGKKYVTTDSGCRGCAFEHSSEEDKITDKGSNVCELCWGAEIFIPKEEIENIPDDRIERLALALAIVHIGDSDFLGRMGRELEKRLLAKYPRLLPWEDDDD